MGEMWNLWHGCHKKSEGCQHCYVYRRNAEFEKDSNVVTKTASFNLPIRRDRQGNWKVPSSCGRASSRTSSSRKPMNCAKMPG